VTILLPAHEPEQAFDRDGNGYLDVSDLAGLLGMVKRVPGKPTSTETGTGAGALVTGLGLEAAMNAMDKDHSGQVSAFR